MAGVGAIHSGSVSARDLLVSAAGNMPVSAANGTKQFENFLKDSSTTQGSAVNQATKSQVSQAVSGQNQNQPKREEFTVNSGENTSAQTAGVSSDQKGLSPEEAEELAVLQEGIRDILKDNLDIDDEMIDAALQMMGATLTDLFQPEVLQQFVLLVNGGGESIDFLTNEDLMNSFTNLLQLMEDFQAENQDTLLPLMEKLETPMLLDEFLEQEGLSADDFNAALENAAVQDDVNAKDYNGQDTISVLHGSEESSEDMNAVQGTRGEESAGSTGEDASEFFFAQREAAAEGRADNVPLFAGQLGLQQVDDSQMIQAQLGSVQRMQQMIDIVNQVSESIRSQVNADTTSVEMQLHPESLGKVFFSVVSKGGVMTASFQVQTEEAKNALESQILLLRDNLEAKNLKVESVEVQVSDFSFTQSNQAEGQSREEMARQSRRKFRYDTEDAENETQAAEVSAEQVRRQVMRDSGGSIDFTA